jgi:hypothetical protein
VAAISISLAPVNIIVNIYTLNSLEKYSKHFNYLLEKKVIDL